MAASTPFDHWDITTMFSGGIGYGVGIGGGYYKLVGSSGSRSENFRLLLYGGSAGAGFGGAISSSKHPERTSRVFFHERTRRATDFQGPGTVVYLGDAIGPIGGNAQALIFSAYLGTHAQLMTFLNVIRQFITTGNVTLPRSIPAIAFVVGTTSGYEISANVILGEFRLL